MLAFLLLGLQGLTGCSHIFYQPTKEAHFDPKNLGLTYEDVKFPATDGTQLHGWFFPATGENKEKPKGTFVQFHGNAQTRRPTSSPWRG